MERLTLRSSDTSHENGVCCTHFGSPECCEVGGNCALNCKWEEAAWERLATYEDSLMSPEQCADAMRLSGLLNQLHGITVGRVVELIESDKAGKNIILPCKPGDRLFILTSDNLNGIEERECKCAMICKGEHGLCVKIVAPLINGEYNCKRWEFTEKDFGRIVFLNYEEAEKARRKNELWSKGIPFYSEW